MRGAEIDLHPLPLPAGVGEVALGEDLAYRDQPHQGWWGSASGPGVLAGVTTTPWATDASFATQSDNADLTALSLSSGSLSHNRVAHRAA